MKDNVGNTIKKLRIERKLHQSEVAKHLRMTRSGYANIENGKATISHRKIILLMELYDVDANYLFNLSTKACACKYKYRSYMEEQRSLFKRLFG